MYRNRLILDLVMSYCGIIVITKDFILNCNLLSFNGLQFILKVLKYNYYFRCNVLTDIFVIDFLTFVSKCNKYTTSRFALNYNVYSISNNFRVLLNLFIKDREITCSIQNYFSSAGWLEREAWDMYGIIFIGNKDLRRILTDYGFKGFPLRKDFPLCGYIELSYDEENKVLSYNPIELAQDYRHFTFKMVWK